MITEKDIRQAASAAINAASELGGKILELRKLGVIEKDGEQLEYPSVSVQLYEAMRRLEDVVARVNMTASELRKYTEENTLEVLDGQAKE